VSDLQAIADRVEIEALRGEFTDAVMMGDFDRCWSLFTPDGVVRIPHGAEIVGQEELRAGAERLHGLLDFFMQTTHPGTIRLDGDTAAGRAYISELRHGHDGRAELSYAVYHDRYRRTPDGWKFTEPSTSSGTSTAGRRRARPRMQPRASAARPADLAGSLLAPGLGA